MPSNNKPLGSSSSPTRMPRFRPLAIAGFVAFAQAAFASVDEEAAIALAKKSDCFKCHSVETKKEGPADRIIRVVIAAASVVGALAGVLADAAAGFAAGAGFVAGAAVGADEPALEGERLRFGPLSTSLSDELLILPPLAEVVPRLAYADLQGNRNQPEDYA